MSFFKISFNSDVDPLILPLPVRSYSSLHGLAAQHFKNVLTNVKVCELRILFVAQEIQANRVLFALKPSQTFKLTDAKRDFTCDADLAHIHGGSTLLLIPVNDGNSHAPARERISFIPHPKTMTMAGEFEYFAAQGRHPFVYALAEFIDNSLRATRQNAPTPRSVTVTLIVSGPNPSTARGLVCISDNGCGMTKEELNDWAVMNYSMEERGAAPQEPDACRANAGAGRFLTGDLSFFGVGSKNAAFFMGNVVKLVTRSSHSRYVSELMLDASALEARYRSGVAVYEEEMIHREAGDASTLSQTEHCFSSTKSWVASELENMEASFTRVIIGDLKPEILRQMVGDGEQGPAICQELAHLYHYYLHGETGNRESRIKEKMLLPNGEALPNINVRYQINERIIWKRALVEVEDDMESRLLRAQKAEFPFTLDVPGKGVVSGIMYYFPFENERETVPMDASKPFGSPLPPIGQNTTQFSTRATQINPNNHVPSQNGEAGSTIDITGLSDDESEAQPLWVTVPVFHAFWQGRLIPGARVDSLPFIEAVRSKRGAQGKDSIPDEVFRRVRGSLFFGPTFKVTRNKLLFRDDIRELLAAAVPGERNIEKSFKTWLGKCHAHLDKSIHFEQLADNAVQASARSRLGEAVTAFERITDGVRTFSKGDVIKCAAKPSIIGRVAYFTVPTATREEGGYSGGQVHVAALPAAVYGTQTLKAFVPRRIEGIVDRKELKDHESKEMQRVPTALKLEPVRYSAGQTIEFAAGEPIPETTAAVFNGAGQHMVKGMYGGEKHALIVTQNLWRLPEGAELRDVSTFDLNSAMLSENAEQGTSACPPAKRGRRNKKRAADENEDSNAAVAEEEEGEGGSHGKRAEEEGPSPVLIVAIENKTPIKETYYFQRISSGLKEAGRYVLEYILTPTVPGMSPIRAAVELSVVAGIPSQVSLSGEAKSRAALRPVRLGEHLPPLNVLFLDEFGNATTVKQSGKGGSRAKAPKLLMHVHKNIGNDKDDAIGGDRIDELEAVYDQAVVCDGCISVHNLRLVGTGSAMTIFDTAQQGSTQPTALGQQTQSQVSMPIASVCISVGIETRGAEDIDAGVFALQVCPGAAKGLRLINPITATSVLNLNSWGAQVSIARGDELPELFAEAVDAFGNKTFPTSDVHFRVTASSSHISPASMSFDVDNAGICHIHGLRASGCTPAGILALGIEQSATSEYAQAAVACAEPVSTLELPFVVEPSGAPVGLQLFYKGQPLPTIEERDDEDGSTIRVTLLQGVEAGVTLDRIHVMLLDESGAPVSKRIDGSRMMVSWRSGSKKSSYTGEAIRLPTFEAPQSTSDPISHWVRFQTATEVIEAPLRVTSVAGAPASWSLSLLDPSGSQSADRSGAVACGHIFTVEVEALDAHNNRVAGRIEGLHPILAVESDGPLLYDEESWEKTWTEEGLYSVRMSLSGHPGPIKIRVSDGQGYMEEDSLTVELRAGSPAALGIDGASNLECGTRAIISALRVRVVDAGGNPCTNFNESFEIAVNSSALATDGTGRSAAVTVAGGNKAKVKRGFALFKDLRVTADSAGAYAVRVQSASRKVALSDAVLNIVMSPQNSVTGLRVIVPAALEENCLAGCAGLLALEIETEDGESIPADVASNLLLKVTPPGGGKKDIMMYTLSEGADDVSFAIGALNVAGTYTAVGEYTETRTEILVGLSKRDTMVRSPTVRFDVLAGPPSTLTVEAPTAVPESMAVTNSSALKQRILVRGAAVQLLDEYGNASALAGISVRCRLRPPGGVPPSSLPAGSQVPVLLAAGRESATVETDGMGRAFIGDLCIAEGSGKAGRSGKPLDLEVVCEAQGLYPSAALQDELEMDCEGWTVCWGRSVVFSDDSKKADEYDSVNQRRIELEGKREQLEGRLRGMRDALAEAVKDREQAEKALSVHHQRVVAPDGTPSLPVTLKQAQKQLLEARKKADVEGGQDDEDESIITEKTAVRSARYGPSRNPLTGAIDRALGLKDPGVIGVFAQLGTVDSEPLALVVGTAYKPAMAFLVVKDMPARQRVVSALASHSGNTRSNNSSSSSSFPMPETLVLSQALPYSALVGASMRGGGGGKRGATTMMEPEGIKSASQLAQQLTRCACSGSDPPLQIPLPHVRPISHLMSSGKQGPPDLSLKEWPTGCLGFLVNLIRPVQKGLRETVFYPLFTNTLVFDTLENAAGYKQSLVQQLRVTSGDIITLCGQKLSGRGVVSGSSFQVPSTAAKADYIFGSSTVSQHTGAGNRSRRIAVLEDWVEALQAKEAADVAEQQAQQEAQQAEAECETELQTVEHELAALNSQLGSSVQKKKKQQQEEQVPSANKRRRLQRS